MNDHIKIELNVAISQLIAVPTAPRGSPNILAQPQPQPQFQPQPQPQAQPQPQPQAPMQQPQLHPQAPPPSQSQQHLDRTPSPVNVGGNCSPCQVERGFENQLEAVEKN